MVRNPDVKWNRWWIPSLLSVFAACLSACSSTPAAVATSHHKTTKPLHCALSGPSVLLTDSLPQPTVSIRVDTLITVTVPPSRSGLHATRVTTSQRSVLRQICTSSLPDGGRISVMKAVAPGKTFVGATLAPATNAFMPSWGGYIVVTK
jgi:hypothetical protein